MKEPARKHPFILSLLLVSLSCSVNLHGQGLSQQYTKHLSIEDGLTQSDITSVVQDKTGFLWLSTHNGLNRYDGYNVIHYKHSLDSTHASISHNVISSAAVDGNDYKWISTKKGIDRIGPTTEDIVHYTSLRLDGEEISLLKTSGISTTADGDIFFHTGHFFCIYDVSEGKFVIHDMTRFIFYEDLYIYDAFCHHSDFFMATNHGIYRFEPSHDYAVRLLQKNAGHVHFLQSSSSLLYTEDSYLYLHSLTNGTTEALTAEGIPVRQVTAILLDSQDNLWIGTEKNGIYVYKNTYSTPVYKQHFYQNQHILTISEDRGQNIWIGTSSNGAHMISQSPKVINTYTPFNRKDDISSVIFSIHTDNPDSIWIGTKNGTLDLLDNEGNILKEASTPSLGRISVIYPHLEKERLWVGGTKGLYTYEKNTNKILPEYIGKDCGFISSIRYDSDSTLICGARNGLFTYENGTMTKLYPYDGNKAEQLESCRTIFIEKDTLWAGFSFLGVVKMVKKNGVYTVAETFTTNSGKNRINNNDVPFITKDSDGNLVICTWGGGVNILKGGKFRTLTEDNGLADNIVFSAYEDKAKKLWISTYNGLSIHDPVSGATNSYTVRDGLPSNEFTVGAHCYQNGLLYLGTINGLVSINPNRNNDLIGKTPVFLSEIFVNNEKVKDGEGMKEIVLPARKNSISLNLTDFNYSQIMRKSVVYKLEGWDKDWYPHNFNTSIRYSNLHPGKYRLLMKTKSSDLGLSTQEIISIRIKRPVFGSIVAIILYVLTALLVTVRTLIVIRRQHHLKNKLFVKETERKYQEELYSTRMRFYTNISHELRTPLTLILGMLERIRSENNGKNGEIDKQLSIAQKNAEKLHQLINEILDFRKIETGNMTVKKESGNIVSFTKAVISYFQDSARNKNILIEESIPYEVLLCSYDEKMTEKILFNLLSNAIKYTKDKIWISLEKTAASTIRISVKDNGCGISTEDQEKIFTRFYQGSNSRKNEGTGVGLNLALEMARLQEGDISIESKEGEGCTFTLELPIETSSDMDEILLSENSDMPIILAIDDNKDITYYIDEVLKKEYQVYSTNNGKDALEIADKVVPDLIICDIMMPDISGIDLCRQFKGSPLTCHIPVILISARSSDKMKIAGLSLGADSFIAKPFTGSYLKAQVKSLLANRDMLKEQIKQELITKPVEEVITSRKDQMLKRITELVEKNMTDSSYDVEELSKDMAMSRMSLYRKMKAITGQSPSEFIREYKLMKATYYLREGEDDINEIFYKTGFNEIKSFRSAFKKRFNMTPNEYKKKCQMEKQKD